MLLGTFGASLLGSILDYKGAIATSRGRGVNSAGYRNKKGKGIIRAGYWSKGSSIKKDF